MRLVPVLSALFTALVIYAFVMERDALRALAGAAPRAEVIAPAAAEAGAGAAAVATPPTPVVALRSQARPIESDIVMRGRTAAAREVAVRAETTGLVISEPLQAGAIVAAGDLLCRLDPGTRPAELAEAEARLLEAEANERASAALAERGFGAETTAISNRAALQSAQASVEQARAELDRLEIRAPFDGLLDADGAERGTLLQPGSDCATLIALDPIRLTGYVPETVIGAITVGAPVVARLQTGQTVQGAVSFVARSADEATRTFRVEARAPNPDRTIRAGITAEIRVAVDGAEGHLVPASALTLDDAGRLGLRTVVDDVARFVPVQAIRDDAAGFWVSGLPDTVEIIVVGQDFVGDGAPVTVTYAEPTP